MFSPTHSDENVLSKETYMSDIQAVAIPSNQVAGEYVTWDGAEWYRISNSHRMPTFFMSIVSASDHWMFISSRGALTTGRQNPDSAIFPYYSADKILDSSRCTGPKTLLKVFQPTGRPIVWEPFSGAPYHDETRSQNLYRIRSATASSLKRFTTTCVSRFATPGIRASNLDSFVAVNW